MSSPDTTELGKVWDPLGLADIGSEETLAWYRHSEIKHGRVGEFSLFLIERIFVHLISNIRNVTMFEISLISLSKSNNYLSSVKQNQQWLHSLDGGQ